MALLAHYWGVDEIAVFVIPAVLAVIGLRWVEKRARSRRAGEAGEDREPADAG